MRPLCELMRTYAPFFNNKYNNKNKKKKNNKINITYFNYKPTHIYKKNSIQLNARVRARG